MTPPPTTPPTISPQPEPLSSYIRTTTQSYISRAAHILGPDRVHAKGKSVIRPSVRIHGDYGAVVSIGRYCLLDEGVVIAPTVVDLEVNFDEEEEEEETTKKAKNAKENFPMSVASPTGFSSNHHRKNRDVILKRMRDQFLANLSPPNSNHNDSDKSNADSNDQPNKPRQKALPLSMGSHTRIGRNTVVRSLSIGSNVHIGSDCLLYPRSVVKDCCIIEDGTVIPPDMVVPPFSRVRGVPGRVVGCLPECWGGEMAERCVEDFVGFVTDLS